MNFLELNGNCKKGNLCSIRYLSVKVSHQGSGSRSGSGSSNIFASKKPEVVLEDLVFETLTPGRYKKGGGLGLRIIFGRHTKLYEKFTGITGDYGLLVNVSHF